MERIININVSGHRISKDGNVAGARGEGNATKLRITFDKNWYGYSKTMTFWDANGSYPVNSVLGTDKLVSLEGEVETYLVPIPSEPMAIAGKMTFVIEGYKDGKRQRTVYDELVVEDSPATPSEPIAPTPTQIEQLQTQISSTIDKYDKAVDAMEHAQMAERGAIAAEASAKATALVVDGKVATANKYAEDAEYNAQRAEHFMESANTSANNAENAVGKVPYIGENGNWFAWDALRQEFYDTGIRAQSGSIVYYGDNPPPEADIWICPDGTPIVPVAKRGFINLLGGAANWTPENVVDDNGNVIGVRYGQVVTVNNAEITSKSKVDMQINSEQLVIFHEKDLAFVAENDGGKITVYCIGSIPQNDYTIQVTVTEVVLYA